MRSGWKIAFGLALVGSLCHVTLGRVTPASAVPTVVPFVAEVVADSGAAPPSAKVDVAVTTLGGLPLWGATFPSVPIDGGVMVLLLGGSGSPAFDTSILPADGALLELTIDDVPLSPPLSMGSVPYALRAQDSATLGGSPASSFVTAGTLAATLHPVAFSGDYADLENAPTGGGVGAVGTPGALARFDTASTLTSSVVTEDAAGRVGISSPAPLASLDIRNGGASSMVLSRPAGVPAATFGYEPGAAVRLATQNAAGTSDRSAMGTGELGHGYLLTAAPGGGSLVQVSTLAANTSYGYVSVDAGQTTANTRGAMYTGIEGAGHLQSSGPNGQLNTSSGTTTTNPNHGSVGVYNSAGSVKAALIVDTSGLGYVVGDIKSFRMAHPTKPDAEIWYASLEGPEAGAYVRGTARLIDGKASIRLPEHFVHVASAEGLTAVVTPTSANSRGLAVVSKSPERIEVVELMEGRGTYEFDYVVTAQRKGFEDFQVDRPTFRELPSTMQPATRMEP